MTVGGAGVGMGVGVGPPATGVRARMRCATSVGWWGSRTGVQAARKGVCSQGVVRALRLRLCAVASGEAGASGPGLGMGSGSGPGSGSGAGAGDGARRGGSRGGRGAAEDGAKRMGNVWAGPLPDVKPANGARRAGARREDEMAVGRGDAPGPRPEGEGARRAGATRRKSTKQKRRPPMSPSAYGTPADRLGGKLTLHDLEQIVIVLRNRPRHSRKGAAGAYAEGYGAAGATFGMRVGGMPGAVLPASFRLGGLSGGVYGAGGAPSLLGVDDASGSPPPSFRPGSAAVDDSLAEVLRTVAANGTDVDFTRLITQLSRAGLWELGLDVFDWLWTQNEIVPSVHTYNAAIACCAIAVQRNQSKRRGSQGEGAVAEKSMPRGSLMSQYAEGRQQAVMADERAWRGSEHSDYQMDYRSSGEGDETSSSDSSGRDALRQSGKENRLNLEMRSAVDRAMRILNQMQKSPHMNRRRTPNVVTYTSVLQVCALAGDAVSSKVVYEEMKAAQVKPNRFTFIVLLKVLGRSGDWVRAKELFENMKAAGVDVNRMHYTTMIRMLTENGRWEDALDVFNELIADPKIRLDVAAYNAAIAAAARGGDSFTATALLQRMKNAGLSPDLKTYSPVIMACARRCQFTGHVQTPAGAAGEENAGDVAMAVFDEMVDCGLTPDLVVWNSLLSVFEHAGDWQHALDVFKSMQGIARPDVITWNTLLSALKRGGQEDMAVEVFEDMQRQGCKPDEITYKILLRMGGPRGGRSAKKGGRLAKLAKNSSRTRRAIDSRSRRPKVEDRPYVPKEEA